MLVLCCSPYLWYIFHLMLSMYLDTSLKWRNNFERCNALNKVSDRVVCCRLSCSVYQSSSCNATPWGDKAAAKNLLSVFSSVLLSAEFCSCDHIFQFLFSHSVLQNNDCVQFIQWIIIWSIQVMLWISTDRVNVNNQIYIDGTILIADNEMQLQELIVVIAKRSQSKSFRGNSGEK